jgi:hypothetical protein
MNGLVEEGNSIAFGIGLFYFLKKHGMLIMSVRNNEMRKDPTLPSKEGMVLWK